MDDENAARGKRRRRGRTRMIWRCRFATLKIREREFRVASALGARAPGDSGGHGGLEKLGGARVPRGSERHGGLEMLGGAHAGLRP